MRIKWIDDWDQYLMADIGSQRNVNSSPLLLESCLVFAICYLVDGPHLLIYPHCWTLGLFQVFCYYNSTIVIFCVLRILFFLNDFLIVLRSLNVTEIVKLKSINQSPVILFQSNSNNEINFVNFLSYISDFMHRKKNSK